MHGLRVASDDFSDGGEKQQSESLADERDNPVRLAHESFGPSLGSADLLEKEGFQQGSACYAVLRALSGAADADRDGVVSLDELG